MNTFEREFRTENLAHLLSCKPNVERFELNEDDGLEIKCGFHDVVTHITGPATVLVLFEPKKE